MYHAIRSTCRYAFGTDDLGGRTVLVQGAGSVGARLIRELREAGAWVLATDVDPARVTATGAEPVDPSDALDDEMRRALALRDRGRIARRDHRRAAVCGRVRRCEQPARNARGRRRLAERGILYAPDYVANAGGVIWLAGYETLGWDVAHMRARLAGIEQTLDEIFAVASAERITTAEAADRFARARIDAARHT